MISPRATYNYMPPFLRMIMLALLLSLLYIISEIQCLAVKDSNWKIGGKWVHMAEEKLGSWAPSKQHEPALSSWSEGWRPALASESKSPVCCWSHKGKPILPDGSHRKAVVLLFVLGWPWPKVSHVYTEHKPTTIKTGLHLHQYRCFPSQITSLPKWQAQRKEVEETTTLFAKVGITGSFWANKISLCFSKFGLWTHFRESLGIYSSPKDYSLPCALSEAGQRTLHLAPPWFWDPKES